MFPPVQQKTTLFFLIFDISKSHRKYHIFKLVRMLEKVPQKMPQKSERPKVIENVKVQVVAEMVINLTQCPEQV